MLNFEDFKLNESKITLSNDLVDVLRDIIDIVSNEEAGWVNEIIYRSGDNFELIKYDNNLDYIFAISDNYEDLEFLEMIPSMGNRYLNIKIGKALKLIVPKIPDHVLSNIVSAIKSNNKSPNIKIVSGEKIREYYKYSDIIMKGTLGNSCMNRLPSEFYDLYVDNPNVVRLAVILDDNYKLIGRALLWRIYGDSWITDRVYYTQEKVKFQFTKWCNKMGYRDIMDLTFSPEIKLDNYELEAYPYLDNLSYLSLSSGVLSNRDVFDADDKVIQLSNTDGTYSPVRNSFEFEPISDINVYKISENLFYFIELSIDFEVFIEKIIEEDTDRYINDIDDFIDTYSYQIDDKLKIKGNIKDILGKLPPDELEDFVTNIIRENYKEFETFRDFNDDFYLIPNDTLYMTSDTHTKKYIDNFVENFCNLDTLNENLYEIYENDGEEYYYTRLRIEPY